MAFLASARAWLSAGLLPPAGVVPVAGVVAVDAVGLDVVGLDVVGLAEGARSRRGPRRGSGLLIGVIGGAVITVYDLFTGLSAGVSPEHLVQAPLRVSAKPTFSPKSTSTLRSSGYCVPEEDCT